MLSHRFRNLSICISSGREQYFILFQDDGVRQKIRKIPLKNLKKKDLKFQYATSYQ